MATEQQPEEEPSPDQIASAIYLMIGTLKLIKDLPELPFPENVKQAIEQFDKPALRTSMVNRLYHPEKYVPQPKPQD